MKIIHTVFFGSTQDSLIVLDRLLEGIRTPSYDISIVAIVSQPPKPIGRKHRQNITPVTQRAAQSTIPILSFPSDPEHPWMFQSEEDVVNAIGTFKPDLIITASFGEKIPSMLLEKTPCGGINIHPSLLPRWRGADPTPWTILAGDAQTGVSLTTITSSFDSGRIIAQKKIPVESDVTPQMLRSTLFTLGARLLTDTLPDYLSGKRTGEEQKMEDVLYARKIKREDGFIPWNLLLCAMKGDNSVTIDIPVLLRASEKIGSHGNITEGIVRMHRALFGWPGIWTIVPISQNGQTVEKRLKLLDVMEKNGKLTINSVQLEGKKPVPFLQFSKAYLLSTSS